MDFTSILSLVIAGLITNNIVLVRSIGICPFLGVSKKLDSSVGMGAAVTFVLVLSSVVCYLLYHFVLVPLEYEYLQTIVFILIIAVLVQLLDIVLKRISPSLYNSLGVYLALITTNCAVLGTANDVIANGYNLLETVVQSVSVGLGFTLALVLMAGIREKMELSKIPKPFQGLPIALITAGIMAIAFAGLGGMTF
ncbi:MAG: RnfABCDGE type electron transport complex subunit A [Clostridia bacterium]|nr:RnfABCDGE type electron transport complex subunit A [Clostridia bacterium]MBR6773984.1 RnfABCDGE type electron transport complex subunit A [Clostridia bacterium]MBR7140599.1 RnfABCDGE type electron transport complex subunit A [Clostridia bacterium]